jgi:hypothetical protein
VDRALKEGYKPRGVTSKRDGIDRSALETAAHRLGIHRVTMHTWVMAVEGTEWEPDWKLYQSPGPPSQQTQDPSDLQDQIREIIVKGRAGIETLMEATGARMGEILDAIETLKEQGVSINRIGEHYEVERSPQPAYIERRQETLEVVSDEDNRFCFGALGDNHAASKYERIDVLESLYDRFEQGGVSQVFHTGNWIDGEARFNRQDLVAFGLEGQARYLAKTYPRRGGISTHAIWGDDHEGWYTREGIDVGRYVEDVMHQEGRSDWHNLGFMEAHVRLVNANTRNASIMAVVHPGGGSAYATSYKPQKIIESLDGGEKPAVALFGHYHKMEILNVRNVWCIQTGTTQDQTPFLRKKSIQCHVGGILVNLEQDPDTGAIIECNGMRRYFNRAHYINQGMGNQRWSRHGPIKPAPRSAGGV